jgi:hypothetical protein
MPDSVSCAGSLRLVRRDLRAPPATSIQELVRGWAVGASQEISMHKDENHIVETAVEARGGLLGKPVLLILLVSGVLAVVALIVTYSSA